MKLFLAMLTLAGYCFSAPLVINNDTTLFWSFKADSLKYGNVAEMTSASFNTICIGANDTNSSVYATDSIKFDYGVQFGSIVVNSLVKNDTAWSTFFYLGRFSTIPSDTAGKWVTPTNWITVDSTGSTGNRSGVMDSSSVTGYAYTSAPFDQPYSCEFVRPWIKGVSGNRVGGWVKVRTQLKQLKYLPTRAQ